MEDMTSMAEEKKAGEPVQVLDTRGGEGEATEGEGTGEGLVGGTGVMRSSLEATSEDGGTTGETHQPEGSHLSLIES